MSAAGVRAAFSTWPDFNERLRQRVTNLTGEELAIVPGAERWPLWASIGHLACQRVFWLCDVAGAPGASTSPFPNAGYDCPGDDDLEHVWSAERLAEALGATFQIVEHCLDTWTLESLGEVIRHPEWESDPERTRGASLERVFAHDIWHIAELNEALGRAGLEQIDLWS